MKAKNNYDKSIGQKYEDDIRALTDLKEKLQYELNIQYEINKDEKNRNDQYNVEFEKLKNLKKELGVKAMELEDMTDAFEKYKRKMDDAVGGQDHIIRQLKKELQEKATEVESTHENKNLEIKTISEKRRIIERELISKEEESNTFKDKCKYQEQ